MGQNPYNVQGTLPVQMLGRKPVLDTLLRHLTKNTPDHVSVIGPKFIGKSVLLKHLADRFAPDNQHYIASIYWDLRHHTPDSDAGFKTRFANEIKAALQDVRSDLARELEPAGDHPLEIIDIILSQLDRDNQRILMVMDDFDRILSGARLSRNLWDSMRDIAQQSSLRLVTGSQRRLRELCKTEDSKTSDFWNIFYDTPVVLGAFQTEEMVAVLQPFNERGITFDHQALDELHECTGGIPVLVCAVLSRVYDNMPTGLTVPASIVRDLAEEIPEQCHDILSELWDDCSFELQNCLADLCTGDIPQEEISPETVQSLETRGYVRVLDNTVTHGCRMMKLFSRKKQLGIENLRLLFASPQGFEKNIKSVLELRLNQCRGVDRELYDFTARAITDLTGAPKLCISGIRGIAEHAISLILKTEIPGGMLPKGWVEGWKHAGETVFEEMHRLEIPRKPNGRCHLLRLMTGTSRSKPVAAYISKPTFLLVDFLQAAGDFGQHVEGNPVTSGFAAAVCSAAVELCESLSREICPNREQPAAG